MSYKISTMEKWDAVEETEFQKDGHKIVVVEECRWGTVYIKNKPDLSGYDPEKGIEIFSSFDVQDYEGEFGTGVQVEYSESMSKRDKKKIEDFLEDHGKDELGDLGWDEISFKTIFRGPLEVEEI